jgi:uncharacterized metal-binding protein
MDQVHLLRCLVHIVGRTAIPAKDVRAAIGKGKNRVKAFNLFDGSHTIQEVARATHVDQGNFSRAASGWVKAGIAFCIGGGNDARLLHIYPIPENPPRDEE